MAQKEEGDVEHQFHRLDTTLLDFALMMVARFSMCVGCGGCWCGHRNSWIRVLSATQKLQGDVEHQFHRFDTTLLDFTLMTAARFSMCLL